MPSILTTRWPWFAALAAGALLAAAHAFERFGGLAPCVLCLRQREAHWMALGLAVALGVLTLVRKGEGARRAACAVLAIAFLYAAGWAAFHMGVEFKWWAGPAACAGGGLGEITPDSIAAALDGAQKVVRCDEVAWRFLGVSMAGWNAIISLTLAGMSAGVAFAPRPRPAAVGRDSHA